MAFNIIKSYPKLSRYLYQLNATTIKRNFHPSTRTLLPASVLFLKNTQDDSTLLAGYRNFSVKLVDNIKKGNINYYLERLKVNATNYGRVNYDRLYDTLKTVQGEHISFDEGIFLLRCIHLLPDKTAADKCVLLDLIWQLILECGFPTRDHVIELIRAYRITGKQIEDAMAFLEQYRCPLDREISEELLYLAAEHGETSDRIVAILALIKEHKYELTERMFNALILGHSKGRNINECEGIVTALTEMNLKPNEGTIVELIKAYIENNCFDTAIDLFDEQKMLLTPSGLFAVIRHAAIYKNEPLLDLAIQELPHDVLNNKKIDNDFQVICIELIYKDRVQDALKIVQKLPIPNFDPDAEDVDVNGVFLLRELVLKQIDVNEIVNICKEYVETKRNSRAYHICCEFALRNNIPNSLPFLEKLSEIEPLRPHYFWPMFIRGFEEKGEAGILSALRDGKRLNVEFDHETIVQYILPKLSITLSDNKRAIKILGDHGLKVSQIISPLITHLTYQQRFGDALQMLQQYPTKLDTEQLVAPLTAIGNNTKLLMKNINIITKLIKQLIDHSSDNTFDLAGTFLVEIASNKNNRIPYSVLAQLLDKFQLIGIRISATSGDLCTQYVSGCVDERMAQQMTFYLKKIVSRKIKATEKSPILHPKDMDIDELECHLLELQTKNLNTRGVVRRLLQMTVRADKLDRAVELYQLCKELKVDISPGMLASIIELHIKTKNLSEAVAMFDKLKKSFPGFLLDEHKVIDLATLYIENGQISNAMNMLTDRSKSNPVNGGDYIQKNIWNLLTAVVVHNQRQGFDPSNSGTKDILNDLVRMGYCTYHNTLLGPIVREHLLRFNIKTAIREIERISIEHKKTPLQKEVLSLLVKITNGGTDSEKYSIPPEEAKTLMQDMIKIVSGVHGTNGANISLIIAFAENGTDNQLRKLLIDPSIKFDPEQLIKQCEHLSNTGKIEALIKLARCSRGLGHTVRENDIYNMLLDSCIRENDCTLALSLFEQILADDEYKVTPEFTKNLIGLLEKNKLEIPTNVQMHTLNVRH